MRSRAAGLAATLLVVATALTAPVAFADAITVDPHAEVAAALYSASATLTAVQKADDDQLRASRARIGVLAAQVKAGDLQRRRELADAQESFVAQLADKDRAYAEAIVAFRGTVTDIASTPEGAAALARFNSGDEAGALAVLDKLQTADEAATQKVTDIGKAVGKRRVAALALEARDRGQVDTASVIARFEVVVRHDPSVLWDWINLDRLDRNVGRTADALRAAQTAASLARTDQDHADTQSELGAVDTALGDLAGARRAYDASLEAARRLATAAPKDLALQRDVEIAIHFTGNVRVAEGDFDGAATAYDEALAVGRKLAAAYPGDSIYQQDVPGDLFAKGDMLGAHKGDIAGALAACQEGLEIMRKVSAANPDNVWFEANITVGLEKVGDMDIVKGDLAAAQGAFDQDLAIDRALAAADPADAALQRSVAVSLGKVGGVFLARHDLAGALGAFQEALALVRRLAAADPANAVAQRDVAYDLGKLAQVLAAQTDVPDAVQDRRECLAIARRLAAADPTNARAQRDLALALAGLAPTCTGATWSPSCGRCRRMASWRRTTRPTCKRPSSLPRRKLATDRVQPHRARTRSPDADLAKKAE
jgi:tetratricopeptide (TPR) repeat protein